MLNFNFSTSLSNEFDFNCFLKNCDHNNTYQNAQSVNNDLSRRILWTLNQDKQLLEQVKNNGTRWSKYRVEGKNGKQCRERYLNHLQQGLKKGPFSVDEKKALKAILIQKKSTQHEKRSWAKVTEMFNEKVYGIKDQKPRSYLDIKNCVYGNREFFETESPSRCNNKKPPSHGAPKRKFSHEGEDDVALQANSVKTPKKNLEAQVDSLVQIPISKFIPENSDPKISDPQISISEFDVLRNTVDFQIRQSFPNFQPETSDTDRRSTFDFLRTPKNRFEIIFEETLESYFDFSNESSETAPPHDYLKETSDGFLEV